MRDRELMFWATARHDMPICKPMIFIDGWHRGKVSKGNLSVFFSNPVEAFGYFFYIQCYFHELQMLFVKHRVNLANNFWLHDVENR